MAYDKGTAIMHIINDLLFIHDGKDYIADVEIEILTDIYGEDADGNRGQTFKEIGRFNVLNVRDSDGNNVSDYMEMFDNIYQTAKEHELD